MFELIESSYNVVKRDNSKLTKIGVGTLLILFSWLIFPLFIYQGYLVQILKETEDGLITGLPSWSNIPQLLINGIIALILSISISVPSLLFNFVPLLTENFVLILVIGNIGAILSLCSSYITTAVVAIYFRDGFDGVKNIKRFKNIFLSSEYLIGFMLTFILGVIFGFIFLFCTITIIGVVFIPPLIVVLTYMSTTIMGVSITRAEQKNK